MMLDQNSALVVLSFYWMADIDGSFDISVKLVQVRTVLSFRRRFINLDIWLFQYFIVCPSERGEEKSNNCDNDISSIISNSGSSEILICIAMTSVEFKYF